MPNPSELKEYSKRNKEIIDKAVREAIVEEKRKVLIDEIKNILRNNFWDEEVHKDLYAQIDGKNSKEDALSIIKAAYDGKTGEDEYKFPNYDSIIQQINDVYEDRDLSDMVVKVDDNYWVLLVNGKQYLYEVSAVGAGGNGTVYFSVDLETGSLVALKMQFGSFSKDEHGDLKFNQLPENRIRNEDQIARKYKPDGEAPLGLGLAKLDNNTPEFLRQVFGRVLSEEELKKVSGSVSIQIQQFMPGERLGEIPEDSKEYKFKHTNNVSDFLKLARNLIAEVKKFEQQTSAYHGDLRPENIFVDANLNVRLIDPGNAMSFNEERIVEDTSLAYTPEFSHPVILRAVDREMGAVDLKEYNADYETYSLRRILHLMFESCKPKIKQQLAGIMKDMFAVDRTEQFEDPLADGKANEIVVYKKPDLSLDDIDTKLKQWKPAVPARPAMTTAKSAKNVRATAPSVPMRPTKSTSALQTQSFPARKIWEQREQEAAAKRKERETPTKGQPKPQIVIPGYNDGNTRPSDKKPS